MAYIQRDNSGSLFPNNKKLKDNHPDRVGTIMVAGVEYYISGWIKTSANGQFLSLSVKPKNETKQAGDERKPQGYGSYNRIKDPQYPKPDLNDTEW